VVVEAYRPNWADEFTHLARRIRALVGPAALRIDHIGSTAVPGLGAKDVIDLQITVDSLDQVDTVTSPLKAAGFRREPEGERRIDGYLQLKEPVFHILYAAASLWAEKAGWRPGEDYR
jgi:GrpB-like predicted nucleotidyltransferase (UPF0157 family)